ncbi:membrane protein [Candidatus Magnetobacterium bavaricum]|uniref:Membrane protein n=1 Tax=Candidatus Magnetobacterium bavaricum TaxID=29290 RepID=A0A0F3GLJ9_9BACT|nr:membrane protein [Candidatus Magnetobacterium bavaricum]
MPEEEARHTHEVELKKLSIDKEFLYYDVVERKRGQLYGLIIGLSGLASAIACAALGHPAVGGIIGGTTVVGLVTVFVIGGYKKRDEKEEPKLPDIKKRDKKGEPTIEPKISLIQDSQDVLDTQEEASNIRIV